MDVEVRLADRGSARELATLHRAAAHTGYAHIFPPDAPPPAYDEDLARWAHWLGPDWDRGRRAYVAVAVAGAAAGGRAVGAEAGGRAVGGRAVGVVLAGPDPEEPGLGHVSRLYVDPACWGHGVGTRLYARALHDLTGRRVPAATLWVLEANVRARRWYERLGWRPTGKRTTTYAPAGIEDVQYRLTLAAGPRPG